MVTVSASTLAHFRRFSLYNSPYPAHDHGCAIDLYPEDNRGRSPVAGEVLDTRTVRVPDRPYAVAEDHLILIDTGEYVARLLHVDPAVSPGDHVAIGESLGEMVRSGFFGQWVDNHVHLGFRNPDANLYRAAGSLPVDVDAGVDVRPLDWDGGGVVREAGETYVVLDEPHHPEPGAWAGLAAGPGVALDGGCPHYDGGGALPGADGPVSLAGVRVGVADGRDVTWDDLTLRANGEPIRGLSLCIARDDAFGAKLVCPGHDFAVGDRLTVSVHRR